MKRLHFETSIDAPRKDVWKAMLEREGYRKWTAEFLEGSDYEGSWEKGEAIRFIAPDGGGMSAVIAENRPYEFVSIKHIGFIKDGTEDTDSEDVRKWAPAFENYTLSEVGGSTKVEVDLDVSPEWEQTMAEKWPKALAKLKEISEA
jgi:uncharacterized protein YndB with AHSA1/START domain